MGKDKTMQYRAICPKCGKPFDSRKGVPFFGHLCCPDCYEKYTKYATLDDYIRNECK
jgi:formylmethanofuran dehydrogenase subunit E